jgi:integrase/recombinase XerD
MIRESKITDVSDYPHITNLADPHGLYRLVQEYLTFIQVKNYSQYTINNREFYLLWFLEWAGQRGLMRPTEITKPILERYQRYIFYYRKKDGEPLSTMCQYNRIVAVRTWFKWLGKCNYILYNPASDLELPKLEKRLPRAVLTESEAESIINQPDVTTTFGIRDRAMLETLYSTGIRRLELIQLKVSDLDCERGTLLVRMGKGKKDRMIPIGERAILWIEKYLNEARPEIALGDDDGILFLSKLGQGLGKNRLTSLIRDYVEAAKVGKKGACHLFRHTMATLMLENGADIRFIQAMLGHVELSTTEIYTQVSIKKLKEVHTLTHPAKAVRTKTKAIIEEPAPTEEDLFTALAHEEVLDPE